MWPTATMTGTPSLTLPISESTYTPPSIVIFLAHLALEGAFLEERGGSLFTSSATGTVRRTSMSCTQNWRSFK